MKTAKVINGNDLDIRGRFVDVNTLLPSDAGDFLVNSAASGDQDKPVISINSDKALVSWRSNDSGLNFDIKDHFLDLNNRNQTDIGDFLVSSYYDYTQDLPAVFLQNNTTFAAWTSNDKGGNNVIRASFVTPRFGNNNFFVSPLLERNYSVKARILY